MLPDGTCTICTISHMFPGLDLCYADPAQPLTTAGEELDDLYHYLICPRCAFFAFQFPKGSSDMQGGYVPYRLVPCHSVSFCTIQFRTEYRFVPRRTPSRSAMYRATPFSFVPYRPAVQYNIVQFRTVLFRTAYCFVNSAHRSVYRHVLYRISFFSESHTAPFSYMYTFQFRTAYRSVSSTPFKIRTV